MKKRSLRQKRVLGALVFVAASGLLVIALSIAIAPNIENTHAVKGQQRNMLLEGRDAWRLPDFTFIERSGKQVTLANLRGKVWIADFIWTRCPDACPLMSAVMARLQAEFADEPELRLVSFSVDPQFDTPAVLASYAAKFGADRDRWLFLTGEKKAIYHVIQKGFKLIVFDPDDAKTSHDPELPGRSVPQEWLGPAVAWAHGVGEHRKKPVIHSDRFVLVDRAGRIRGYYRSADSKDLIRLKQDTWKLLRTGGT
jgi:protein SCO1/2